MRTLYLGLDPKRYRGEGAITHLPIIQTIPKSYEEVKRYFEKLPLATHIVLTSRTAASYFFAYTGDIPYRNKRFLAIGQSTAALLYAAECRSVEIAPQEQGEGVVQWLQSLTQPCHLFYPHSSLSRTLIDDALIQKNTPFTAFALYDTLPRQVHLPDLSQFEKIVFTSPSTVSAFFNLATKIPPIDKCVCIGPITQQALKGVIQTCTEEITRRTLKTVFE